MSIILLLLFVNVIYLNLSRDVFGLMAVRTELGMWSNLRSGRQGNRVLSSAAGRAGAWQR